MLTPYNYIQNTGVIVPDTANILTGVQQEYQTVFSETLIVTANTPQGVLINTEALARNGVATNNAALANQFNRNQSGGIFLDALGALLGQFRLGATSSTVSVNLGGVAATLIPAGSIISDGTNQWASLNDATLNDSGMASTEFQAVIPGVIAAGAYTLTQIVNGVLGWETATNPDAATVGIAQQSDSLFKIQQNNTIGIQGSTSTQAILAGLYGTLGVTSAIIRDNDLNTTQTVDGIVMPPNSLYACVAGGADDDVATTLNNKKTIGCAYLNAVSSDPVSVTVIDPYSGQSKIVLFDRPTPIPILIQVTIPSVPAGSTGAQAEIIAAVLAYANGDINNEPGFGIGDDVSCFEISGAINQANNSYYVSSVETTTNLITPDFSSALIPIQLYQQATVTYSQISVVISP